MRWRLEDLVLDGTGSRDAEFTIELDGIRGLFGGVGVRPLNVDRANAHGKYDLPVFREARMLSASGLILAPSQFYLEQRMARLSSVLGDGRSGLLMIDAESGAWSCQVRVAQDPSVSVVVPGRVARYQLFLVAADPRLYGAPRRFAGGAVDVFHYGNFPAFPVVEVTGGRLPYTISGPGGRRFEVTQSLSAGSTHRIDFRTGRLYRDGVLQVGGIGRADVWTIPPGSPTQMSISAGSMTVTTEDTYI